MSDYDPSLANNLYTKDAFQAELDQRAEMQALKEARQQEEEEEKQVERQAQQAEQEKEDSKHLGDKILDTPVVGQIASVGAGVTDTALDIAGMIPWLKPIEESWDEHHGREREDNPLNKFIRDASGLIIPSLTGGGMIAKGLQGAATAGKLGAGVKAASALKRTQVLGRIATDLGVSTAVEAVSDQTEEAGNVASALEELFNAPGSIPWASREEDNPDVRYQKNMYEAAAMGGFVGLIDGLFALKKGYEFIPKNDKSTELLNLKLQKENVDLDAAGGDVVVAKIEAQRAAREEAITDEAVRRFEYNDGTYDPYIHEPHQAIDRPAMNFDADPAKFMVDNHRILNNIGTTNGRPTPVVTDHYKFKFLDAGSSVDRNKLLDDLASRSQHDFDVTFQGAKEKVTLKDKDIKNSVDTLVKQAFEIDTKKFEEVFKKNMDYTTDRLVVGGKQVDLLTTAGMKEAGEVLKKGLDMLDPDRIRSAAKITSQSAGDAADLARGIAFIAEDGNIASQADLLIDNLSLVLRETGIHKAIKGYGLKALDFTERGIKTKQGLDASFYEEAGEVYEQIVKQKSDSAATLAKELKAINKENPQYLKPLWEQYLKTGGDIDTMEKINQLVENRLGFWKKAFVDGESQYPSYLLQELNSARYNSVLNGLAPVRAVAGGAMALIGKPLTTFVGSVPRVLMDRQEGLGEFKRAMYTYGGVVENIQRGFKNLKSEWKHAVENPRGEKQIGRADVKQQSLDDFQTLERMSSEWMKKGDFGKVAAWNITKGLSYFNNWSYARWGVNSMSAIDGFTKSMTRSMAARSKAYDELFSQSNGAFDTKAFETMQRKLYNDSFDADGLMTNKLAQDVAKAGNYAAGEINLNLDMDSVKALEGVMKHFPLMRSIFMFPRTGMNALELAATFNPGNMVTTITNGKLNLSLGKARRLMTATTDDQIKEVLSEHGLSGFGSEAFKQLKSEYLGRYTAGSAVTMGAAMLAAHGMITGSGPQDDGEKRRMQAMGWKPFSFWDPVGQQWRSYQGLEPFDTFLGLTADIAYNFNRVDQAVTEDWFRAIAHSITMNVSNKSFLSGFEPLVGLITMDPSQITRYLVNVTDSTIPGAGVRSILNKVITPQLKDVQNNYFEYLANRNKWLVGDKLETFLDVYTGMPINTYDPMNRAINSVLPFFKTNGGMEPWRKQLLASGWDGLQAVRRNKIDGKNLRPSERQFINNWIAQNYQLGRRVEDLFNQSPKFWEKEMKKYVKDRGLKTQEEYPIKQTLLHDKLNQLHNEAFDAGFAALAQENAAYGTRKNLQQLVNTSIKRGDYKSATQAAEAIKNIPK